MNELLLELVAKLEAMAPQVWQAAMRQVYVNAVMDSLMWMVLLVAMLWVFVKVRGFMTKDNDDAENGLLILSLSLIGMCMVCAALFLVASLKPLLNPEWAAIQMLLKAMADAK